MNPLQQTFRRYLKFSCTCHGKKLWKYLGKNLQHSNSITSKVIKGALRNGKKLS